MMELETSHFPPDGQLIGSGHLFRGAWSRSRCEFVPGLLYEPSPATRLELKESFGCPDPIREEQAVGREWRG